MSYLLDTNVICELVKAKPNPLVINWVDAADTSALYISVLTLGELRKGVSKIKDAKRHQLISEWLEYELPAYFGDRILIIDEKVADAWGAYKVGMPDILYPLLIVLLPQQHWYTN
ncbi:MAG: PIN domain-containing protein [Legionellales bacterium]